MFLSVPFIFYTVIKWFSGYFCSLGVCVMCFLQVVVLVIGGVRDFVDHISFSVQILEKS